MFTLTCNNKGCGNNMQPYIDPATDKVYCSDCKKEMQNISPFVKNQMKMNKQYKKKESNSFSVKCNKCNNLDRPKLQNNKVICTNCNNIIDNISPVFVRMLKEELEKIKKDA